MNLKFSSKIMTLVTVSVILSVSLTSGIFYNILQEQIINDKIERSTSISKLVSNQLANAVYFSDLSEMNSIIGHLVEQDEFKSVKILDNNGGILASSYIETSKSSQSLSAFEDKAIKTKNISKNFQNYVLSIAYPIETSERIGTLVIVGHLDELENILNELLLLFLIIGIFVSIVTSVVAMIFSKSLTTPIHKIQKIATEISKGNSNARTHIRRMDEIGDLSSAIDSMAESLEKQKEELSKTERLSAIGILSSRLSHDIRNPLTVIQGTLDFMKFSMPDANQTQIDCMERMQKSVKRINHQIENVLDHLRQKSLQLDKVSLHDVMNLTLENILVPTNIKIEKDMEDVEITCDSNMISVVFVNLIMNAIQALTKNGGIIKIRLYEKNENKIIIEIEDNGLGIPDDVLSKIFEPLFTTKQEGTGLGLSSCKSIIEQHGGTIIAKNNPTVFSIELPKV